MSSCLTRKSKLCLLLKTRVIIFLQEKQEQLRQVSGEEVLRGDDFKSYINTLRTKSSIYKMKRAELSDLRSEYGILSRTQEILKAKEAQINNQLVRDLLGSVTMQRNGGFSWTTKKVC